MDWDGFDDNDPVREKPKPQGKSPPFTPPMPNLQSDLTWPVKLFSATQAAAGYTWWNFLFPSKPAAPTEDPADSDRTSTDGGGGSGGGATGATQRDPGVDQQPQDAANRAWKAANTDMFQGETPLTLPEGCHPIDIVVLSYWDNICGPKVDRVRETRSWLNFGIRLLNWIA